MAVPNSITMLNNARPLNFRGRCRRGFWVVGIVERATGRCWLERVRRRDAPTLERIIAALVLPGVLIHGRLGRIQQCVHHQQRGVQSPGCRSRSELGMNLL